VAKVTGHLHVVGTPAKRQVQVRLDDDDAELLKQLAAEDGRSVTNYVQRVLIAHLAELKAQPR
jgi:uncharacterized protein (DUF1778 family)